jgi:hypothetical protein
LAGNFTEIALSIAPWLLKLGILEKTYPPAFMINFLHPHLDVFLSTLLAQAPNSDIDTDILAKIQVSFKNFLESGQAGAMTIGLIFGYVVRGITK